MRRDDEPAIRGQGLIEGTNRPRTSDKERHDIARENDDVLEGQERMSVMESRLRIHGGHTGVPRI